MHPPIFYEFERKKSISDGRSVYDFLGGAIDSSYKGGWDKNVFSKGEVVKPRYPSPSEWSVDWIACLLAARLAGERFTVIELGAGYGQWMVTAIMAYKALHPDRPAHGMALEADKTHYEWLRQHVQKNLGRYPDVHTDLLHAAAGYDGVVQFPVLEEPERDYGASYLKRHDSVAMHEVTCLSSQSIDISFNEKCIDILHVDIQGAEEDLIANEGFEELLSKTRFALFGTHRSSDLHDSVKSAIESAEMKILAEWPRNSIVSTSFGDVQTNDGAILAINPELRESCERLLADGGFIS